MAKRNNTRERGRMMYVPRIVIEELDSIQAENEINSRSVAFDKMVINCRRGRASKRMDNIDLFRQPKKRRRDIFGGLI